MNGRNFCLIVYIWLEIVNNSGDSLIDYWTKFGVIVKSEIMYTAIKLLFGDYTQSFDSLHYACKGFSSNFWK